MSRRREGLADLLKWNRKQGDPKAVSKSNDDTRPNTAVLEGSPLSATAGRQGRPATSLGLLSGATRVPSTSTSASGYPQQSAHGAASRPGGLPPLSKGGSQSASGASPLAAPPSSEQPPESLTHFQEALYANGHPHNATSRLLRLGAGAPSPPRRSSSLTAGSHGASAGPMPPISPQGTLRRTQSPASVGASRPSSSSFQPPPLASAASADSGIGGGGSGGPVLVPVSLPSADAGGATPGSPSASGPGTGPGTGILSSWRSLPQSPSAQAHTHIPQTPQSPQQPGSSLLAGKKMSWTAWAMSTVAAAAGAMGAVGAAAGGGAGGAGGGGGGGGGMPSRATGRLGSRDSVAMIEEARRLAQQAAEVLYSNEEVVTQSDRAAAATALSRLEALLGSREVGATALSQAARSMREELGRLLHLSDKQAFFTRSQLQVLERQHERLRQQLHPRPANANEPLLPALSHDATGIGGGGGSPPTTPAVSVAQIACGLTAAAAPAPAPALPPNADPLGAPPLRAASGATLTGEGSLTWPPPSSSGAGGGGGAAAGGTSSGGALLSALSNPTTESGGAASASAPQAQPGGAGNERWSLTDAIDRTVRRRALSAAEQAVAAVAASAAATQRRDSRDGSPGDGGPGVDVEELRRLKDAPLGQGEPPPSYVGVIVRRAPSPHGLGGAAMGRSLAVSTSTRGGLGGFGGYGRGFGPNGGGWGGAGGGGGGAPLDPRSVLQWSNRGISTSKMPLLREVLVTSPQLVRLGLAGNKLSNEDVAELMVLLSDPAAPRVRDLELEQNTSLTWRCALPLALALGLHPDSAAAAAADWAAVQAAVTATAAATAAAAAPSPFAPAAVLAPHGSGHPGGGRGPIRRLGLTRLGLCGVRLGDKGVSQLAEGLRANHSLRELDLRRCGLSDAGGCVLMEVLGGNGTLARLDVSWNAMRAESARALEGALAGNAGLRELGLAHNGFGDVDGARIVKGMLSHGTWLRVDLSYNGLGPGTCMMVSELMWRLGEAASELIADGTYCEAWGAAGGGADGGGGGDAGWDSVSPPQSPSPLSRCGTGRSWGEVLSRRNSLAAQRQTSQAELGGGGGERGAGAGDSGPPSPGSTPSSTSTSARGRGGRVLAGHLGAQLRVGQPGVCLDGCPLGHSGLRILMDGMEAMGSAVCAAAGAPPPESSALEEAPDWLPPPPLHLSVSHCNVAPPTDRSSDGDDINPFLPSISVLCRPSGSGYQVRTSGAGGGAAGGGKGEGGKKAAGKANTSGGKDGSRDAGPAPPSSLAVSASAVSASGGGGSLAPPLTLASPHLNLQSPAGLYSLDLSHPATGVLLGRLLRTRQELAAAVAEGRAAGVGLALCNMSVNGKPIKPDQLGQLEGAGEGTLLLSVRAPALLSISPPSPMSHLAAAWLAGLLADPAASPLWKLGVLASAGSVVFFAPGQAAAMLAGFDATTQASEAVSAAQMLYARSCQPLAFWRHVIPRMSPSQQEALRARLGELVALDLERPVGRYTLNLSRQLDRFVALRLQLASALEASWTENKYYVNWLNATFNGHPLDRPGLTRIRDFTLPGAGVLRLDYVTYLKPVPGQTPAAPDDLDQLLAALRGCNIGHIAALLQVRQQLAPPSPGDEVTPPRAGPGGLARRRPTATAPRPRPRMTALQLTRTSLADVAMRLALPPPPPPAPPQPPSLPAPTLTAPSVAAATAAPSEPDGGGSAGSIADGGGGGDAAGSAAPERWIVAAGFDPEPLFRCSGVLLPELRSSSPEPPTPPTGASASGGNVTAAGGAATRGSVTGGGGDGVSLSGGAAGAAASAAAATAVVRAMITASKSARSLGGRSGAPSVATGARRGRRGRRRGGEKEGEGEEEDAGDWRRARADYHASLLALVHQASDLPLIVSKMAPAHLAAAVASLLRIGATTPTSTASPSQPGGSASAAAASQPSASPSSPSASGVPDAAAAPGGGGGGGPAPGARAVAALLGALPPLLACRFLFDQSEPSPCLLPPDQRRAVAGCVGGERLRQLEAAARGSSEAALQRQRAVRAVLALWAEGRVVTGEQVASVLGCLQSEVDRVTAAVALWPRVVDGAWKPTFLKLSVGEQRQVMSRLGHWHVYACLGDPHGVSFCLDLGEPEQRDIAKELLRAAVKETARGKQEARARGSGYAASNVQTLLDLHGNGYPVSIPEDEKLWGMAEANFKTIEFLYTPTFEQSLQRVSACVVRIQRAWMARLAARRAAAEEAARRAAEVDELDEGPTQSHPRNQGAATR